MGDTDDRKTWMGLLAQARAADVAALWKGTGLTPDYAMLRAPEIGGVMVRGRTGATGAPFNLGEMTVTRCTLKLADGTVGHGYVQGRDKSHATQAALVDALMQTGQRAILREQVLDPLRQAKEARLGARAARAAATKVEFFTMVRGED